MPVGTNMHSNIFLEVTKLPDTSDFVKHFLKEKKTQKTSYFFGGMSLENYAGMIEHMVRGANPLKYCFMNDHPNHYGYFVTWQVSHGNLFMDTCITYTPNSLCVSISVA